MAEGLSIRVDGATRVANKYRHAAAKFRPELDGEVGKWTKAKAKELRATKYPPKLPNQKYKRTGQLGRRWSAHKVSMAIWEVINRAISPRGIYYAPYVVHEKLQALIHKGRWWTVQEKTRPAPTLTKALSDMLKRLLK